MKINKAFKDLKLNEAEFFAYENYDGEGPEGRSWLSYGDLRSWKEYHNLYGEEADVLYMPDVASGSDYSGSDVEKSNYEALKRDYLKRSKYVYDVAGGHGTYAIAFNLTRLKGKLAEELADTFKSLSDYPLYDEDHWSELQTRQEEEDWASWIEGDFKRELKKSLEKLGVGVYEIGEGIIEGGSVNSLWDIYLELKEATNTEYIIEEGCSGYVDLEKLCNPYSLGEVIAKPEILSWLIVPTLDPMIDKLKNPDRSMALREWEEEFTTVASEYGIMESKELSERLELLDRIGQEYGYLTFEEKDKFIHFYLGQVLKEMEKVGVKV